MLYTYFIVLGSLISINLISTFPERLVIFAIIVLSLFQLSKRLNTIKQKRFAAILFAGATTLLIGLHLYLTILRSFPLIFIVTILALFLLSRRLVFTKRKKIISAAVAALITISISANVLSDIHRFIFLDQAVTRFAKGDFNFLALDMDKAALHVVGPKANHFLSFNIDALDVPPKQSEVETGFTRTFLYNDQLKEIYNYNRIKQQLDIIDSTALTIKKSLPIMFPQGIDFDTVIEMERHTGFIIVTAIPRGNTFDKSTVIVNRTEEKIVKEVSLSPMNILINPTQPLLYMSWWQHSSNEIISYDLEKLEISEKVLINARIDRMTFLKPRNELLVTIPVKSMIYRLDADTLAIKGQIRSTLGVRTLAVDSKRNLLLTLSLVSGYLDVIDLNTYESKKRYYLAPWLRSIVLDGRGTAYVSSFGGLFKIQYDKPE